MYYFHVFVGTDTVFSGLSTFPRCPRLKSDYDPRSYPKSYLLPRGRPGVPNKEFLSFVRLLHVPRTAHVRDGDVDVSPWWKEPRTEVQVVLLLASVPSRLRVRFPRGGRPVVTWLVRDLSDSAVSPSPEVPSPCRLPCPNTTVLRARTPPCGVPRTTRGVCVLEPVGLQRLRLFRTNPARVLVVLGHSTRGSGRPHTPRALGRDTGPRESHWV